MSRYNEKLYRDIAVLGLKSGCWESVSQYTKCIVTVEQSWVCSWLGTVSQDNKLYCNRRAGWLGVKVVSRYQFCIVIEGGIEGLRKLGHNTRVVS